MANPNRPNYIDLQSTSSPNITRPMRSPRLHIAGEVPPELSPLDAFAMQSRLLARQLEESVTKDGNRVSRLPPLTISSPLIVQGRSDYFRSMSQEASPDAEINYHNHHNLHLNQVQPVPQPSAGLGLRTAEVEDAFNAVDRPVSMHPRMSRIPPTPDDHMSMPMPLPTTSPATTSASFGRGRTLGQIDEGEAYFGARREQSPSPLEAGDGAPLQKETSLTLPEGPSRQNSGEASNLLPPRPMFQPRRPSSQSVASMSSPHESADELAAISSSIHSLPPRKMSSASGSFSPAMNMHRSPSVASESSVLPRPSFNFSRPISRSGTPTLEPNMPMRQASSDSQPSFLADDVATPISIQGEGFGHLDEQGGQSYIYSKFALPRGKSVQRNVPLDRSATADAVQLSASPSTQNALLAAPPSPPTRPSTSSGRLEDEANWEGRGRRGRGEEEDQPRDRAPAPTTATPEPPRLLTANSATTTDSARTLKPARSQHSLGPSVSDMTAEEHLAKGIQCHEKGSLNESTWHLRHAAKMNNPTAMLLYALACRHGWGMRPNQSEGVQWLKKAAEFASVEIADDEGLAKQGKHVDKLDSRTHKAQFALSIYELGVSHMNGWGIDQDKALALRCFEIAGSWGDIDALAEAGFCYAKGVGCKKDLQKSARFYRQAEAKGMSMVGNSWIHKSKYDEVEGESKKKRARSKSRTRTMFGRIGGS